MLTVCTDGFQEIQLGEVDETNMSSLQNVQKKLNSSHGALHICLEIRLQLSSTRRIKILLC